jgi:signal transduction histidine kinase
LAVHRLERRLGDEPASRECLASIGEEIENLRRISETFSEFARMPVARWERTDLARIAASVAELYRDSVPGVELRLTTPETLPLVGDRDLLRRALSNLVKNAGQALEKSGGTIHLTVQKTGNVAMVEVIDDGPGVPEELRNTLFRPGVSGRTGGSGLGLAIVQRIASDHRGTLEWREAHPGSAFVLRIPTDLAEET